MPPESATDTHAVYLALGDSLAVGVGASRPAETGYVPRLHRAIRDGNATAARSLRNLAVSGETSASMLQGGQLEAALELIDRGDPPVALVTLDIGGNDLLALLRTEACQIDPLGPSCLGMLATTLGTFEANLRTIVGRLCDVMDGAEARATLALMTYYNPFSGANPHLEAAADLALLGTDRRIDCGPMSVEARGTNDVIACVGRESGAVVVDVHPPFVGRGLELTNIAMYDVHANDRGYALIADRFVEALRVATSARAS
jgi:lysophospholipase L1-like esterase